MTRLLAFTLAAAIGLAAAADQVTIEPSKDNTLIEDTNGEFSNGSGPGIFAGRIRNLFNFRRRALIAFDVASAVPAGSTINEVRLTLTVDMVPTSLSFPFELRRVSRNWGEGASNFFGGTGGPAEPNDATWIHTFYDSQFWSNSGGDFASSPSAARDVGGTGPYTWASTSALVSDVQGWLDSPSTNFGWVVLGNENTSSSVKRFASREHSNPSMRPALFIDFTPPGGCDGCDANCDNVIDAFDIEPFIDLLVSPTPTPCSPCAGDANGDMVIDAFDIEPFINCLVGP